MDGFPLSRQQSRIWRWHRTGSAHAARCVVDVEGDLRIDRLRAALDTVVGRHQLLRTRFVPVEPALEPLQVPDGSGYRLDVSQDDGGQAPRYTADPTTQGPPLRVTVFPRGPGRHTMVLTLPALCADARSLRNVVAEIALAHGGEPLPVDVPQYARFAAWQDQDAAAPASPVAPDVWHPGQAVALEPATESAAGYDAHATTLAPGVVAELDRFCARQRVPAADIIMACWQVLIWQHARAADVVVGRIQDGRVLEELTGVIGPGTSVRPVRLRLAGTDRFVDVLRSLRRALDNLADDLADDPADGPGPAEATPAWGYDFVETAPAAGADGVLYRIVEHAAWTAPFAVALLAERDAGTIRLVLEHDTGRIAGDAVRALLEQLPALIAAAVADPAGAIGALPAVDEEQAHRQAVEFNRTGADFAADGLAHQTFEARAAQAPDRAALTFGPDTLTYGELNARANRLARRLRDLGARPETPVGVCLDRGAEMVVAVLAVQKAGAAYVPLDPTYPRERIRAVLDDTAMPLVVADERTAADLPRGRWHPVLVDRESAGIAALPGGDLGLEIHPEQLAYILHTSGSTGRPKGVQISYAALANFLGAMRATPGITAEDNLVAVTTLSFDIAALELFLPLTVGARVTVASRRAAADPHALAGLLREAAASMLQATPVTWRMLLGSGWSAPDLTALVGGEALPPQLAEQLAPRVRQLWNMYGPTETTVWSTCAQVHPGNGPVTVGRPVANTCVHVVDRNLRPVAIGMVGELCIGGAGVARGYAGQPALTADRFVPDTCGRHAGARMYRTGDLARHDPAGRLYVLGRADSQVKIRGFRIELGEVEAALARHPAVRAAIASARPDLSGEHSLYAHVVLEPDGTATAAQLREFLRGVLPAAMVPTRIGVLEQFPLTSNGKVDRGALPVPAAEQAAAADAPAGTDLERTIAKIWASVLGVEHLGLDANFFDLGGHSVLLVQASGLLQDELGREITPLTMLEHPTIGALARHLEGPDESPPLEDRDHQPGRRERMRLRRTKSVTQ
jgi:amino acid adenylation domain-containing protein